MPKFINTELQSGPESELESDTKLESKSDRIWHWIIVTFLFIKILF